MPELAFAIQQYLEPHHLASACRVNRTWCIVWSPFLWQTLTLTQPNPVFRLRPLRASSFPTVPSEDASAEVPVEDLYRDQEEGHIPSEAGLTRYGHHVQQLHGAWLRTQTLVRVFTHCLQLQHVKLSDTSITSKLLKSMLTALTGLKRLDLDLPLGDLANHQDVEDEDEGEEYDIKVPNEVAFLGAIEKYASPTLNHLKLTFQTVFKMPVEALCSLLRHHPALLTLKLVDVDIIKHGKSTRKQQRVKDRDKSKDRRKDRNGVRTHGRDLSSESGLRSRSSSSSSLSLSTHTAAATVVEASNSTLEDRMASLELSEPVMEPFSLVFLSITSSHTPDTTLSYVLESCSHLRALHLHSCDTLTDETLKGITQHLPSLTSISISSCKKLTPAGLDYLFSNTPQLLVHVHLCDVAALRDESLDILAQRHAPTLQKLAVYFCRSVTDHGVKALLTTCGQLRVLGLQAYGMSTKIFDEPWACQDTLEYLDLQTVFKLFIDETPTIINSDGIGNNNNPSTNVDDASSSMMSWKNLKVRAWREIQSRIDAFGLTRRRLMTLSKLRTLRIYASGIGKEVLEGFGQDQQIQILYLYGLQSTQVDQLPWSQIRKRYPYLKQIHCPVLGDMKKDIKEELARRNIELFPSSSTPDLAFENNFDD